MFVEACQKVEKSLYVYRGSGTFKKGEEEKPGWSFGTAFMIAPGVLATAKHLLHAPREDVPVETFFAELLVRLATRIDEGTYRATVLATDPKYDLALLRLENPPSTDCLHLDLRQLPIGTSCGTLGYSLMRGASEPIMRFTSGFISAFYTGIEGDRNDEPPLGFDNSCYETDMMLYTGASGSPGFLSTGRVFGLHSRSLWDPFVPPERFLDPDEGKLKLRYRLHMSLWVPSIAIVALARANNVPLPRASGNISAPGAKEKKRNR